MEVSAEKAPLPHIPIEIIHNIFSKSRVKTLIRCQCVCKEWRSIIQDSDFKFSYRGPRRAILRPKFSDSNVTLSIANSLCIKNQFLSSLLNTWGICSKHVYWSDVWCSCNGFVLCSIEEHIILCNLSTRCYTKVLELQFLKDRFYRCLVSGLCYVPSTKDYKVVLIVLYDYTRQAHGYYLVASLRNKKWLKMPFPYILDSTVDGFEFHGTLHWRVMDFYQEYKIFPRWNKIVYFDPECDEFRELPTPEPRQREEEEIENFGWGIIGLGTIDDCLCMARDREEIKAIEVLVMKEYNIKESWISLFVISASKFGDVCCDMELYSSSCKSKVLIWSRGLCKWRLFVYELKNNKLNNILEKSETEHPFGICFYVQSLASPNEFIWSDDQHKHCAESADYPENL